MIQIIVAYGAFVTGMMLFLVPQSMWGGLVAMVCLIASLILAILTRKDEGAESRLIDTHATWIIRSFWLFMLYSVVAIMIFAGFFSANADHTALQALAQMEPPVPLETIEALTEQYEADNRPMTFWLNLSLMLPLFAWIAARLGRGMWLISQNRDVARVKTWLI